MDIGINIFALKADDLVPAALLAERCGYAAVWYGEHLILPVGGSTNISTDLFGAQEFLDPLVVLGHLGAVTHRIRLGTGILKLPLRAPVPAARQILAVDVLSGGRLDLGVGVGWSKAEYDAAGTDLHTRGARSGEMLEVLDTLFREGIREHHGKIYDVPPCEFRPLPVQRPRPPFLVSGTAQSAKRRAAKWDGWIEVPDSVEAARDGMREINEYRRELGRDGQPYRFLFFFTRPLSREEIDGYARIGADQLIISPWGTDYHNALDRIESYAREIGLTLPTP